MHSSEEWEGTVSPAIGLLLPDNTLRALVANCLSLPGFDRTVGLDTNFRGVITGEFLQQFINLDILLVQAFNPLKHFVDGDGFRLARTLAGLNSLNCRPLVLFESMPSAMDRYPCFIDYAGFSRIDAKITGLLQADALDTAFAEAETLCPVLTNLPDHYSPLGGRLQW